MAEYTVEARVKTDNTKHLVSPHTKFVSGRPRKLGFFIEERGEYFRLKIQPGEGAQDFFPDPFELWEADISLSKEKLWGHVKECRQAWRYHVVDRKVNGRYIFQDRWDLTDHSAVYAESLGQVALAGSNLFQAIFFPEPNTTDAENLEKLRKIGQVLQEKMSQGSYWIRVISRNFHAPWNLLYSKEIQDTINGSDVQKEGFWGYQHIVEQGAPDTTSYAGDFSPTQPLKVALQLDESIDKKLKVACNEVVLKQLSLYREDALSLQHRNRCDDFARALATKPLSEHVLYFCCHGEAEGDFTTIPIDTSYLMLTDTENRIKPARIKQWMGQNRFVNGPIVFLNACQSAQSNSIFYDSFSDIFLGRSASTVIGSATDVPAILAGEFASRFFETFFEGGTEANQDTEQRVGDVMMKLRREFMDVYKNPLALLYSVYHGADAFMQEPIPKKPQPPTAKEPKLDSGDVTR